MKAQPYRLLNKIQNYPWGGRNENAFIPKFLGFEPQPDLPYAELWIGAHPKASSAILIDKQQIQLSEIIDKYPREILGDSVAKKFSNKFPFLLKVLSAGQMLSIQTHPNKLQAAELHKKDPSNYPDENHKPEIAIAIDSLKAIAGFKLVQKIADNLKSLPELIEFVGIEESELNSNLSEGTIKKFYSAMMKRSFDSEDLAKCITGLVERFEKKNNLTKEENLFLEQYKIYGIDVGLLSFFFFNLVELKAGQAIFTDAGIPHAYIKGNIIECMANSDNVIRAGLTNKYKDIVTLLDVMKYEFGDYPLIQEDGKNKQATYKTSAEEFEITSVEITDSIQKEYSTKDKPSIFLMMNGKIDLMWNNEDVSETMSFEKGESFLIPAFLKKFSIQSESTAKFIIATTP